MSRSAALKYISSRREGPAIIRHNETGEFIVRGTGPKRVVKRGKTCLACGMERSLAGRCECNS